MRQPRPIIQFFALFLASTLAAEAGAESLQLKWIALPAAVGKRKVTVVLSSKAQLRGTITSFQADSLQMHITGSSGPAAYPAGQASIPREEVTQIRIRRIRGAGRAVGAAGAGAAAAFGALPWAITDERVNASDRSRIVSWAAITAGAAVGGYFIGRVIDSRETVVTVLPRD